jgi:hypothetical protein
MVIFREGDLDGVSYGHGPHSDRSSGTNGTRDHPAVITRAWGSDEHSAVNLMVFFDATGAEPRNSVMPLQDLGEGVHNPNQGWRWPTRD